MKIDFLPLLALLNLPDLHHRYIFHLYQQLMTYVKVLMVNHSKMVISAIRKKKLLIFFFLNSQFLGLMNAVA